MGRFSFFIAPAFSICYRIAMKTKLSNTENIITVYHGTVDEFGVIDVSKGKPYKDFGRGFYAAWSMEHAIRLAERNAREHFRKTKSLSKKRHLSLCARKSGKFYEGL